MKRISFIIVALLPFIGISCKKCDCTATNTQYCGTSNPSSDKEFIKAIIQNNPNNTRIDELTYNGNEGYLVTFSSGTGSFSSYYDCSGNGLFGSGGVVGTTYPADFGDKTTYIHKIYPK